MYDSQEHHRHSIRLPEYDYANEGAYFVTICVQNREPLFGKIVDGEMILNDAGKMVGQWYQKIADKYPNAECGDYIVMPNHFHCIIHIVDSFVGADPRVRPEIPNGNDAQGGHMGPPLRTALPQIIQWFKTMTTNDYIRGVKTQHWAVFDRRLWQRNYFEHIIRYSQLYQRISEYIQTNPLHWKEDALFSE